MIVIMHREKMYVRMKFDDAIVEREQKESGDPRAIIKEVLKCDYKSLGRATIDGVEVEGFRTTDPKYHSGALRQFNVALGQVDVKLWVEVRTWLPIRAEEDIQMDDGTYMHTVVSDFQWDVPVDAAQFEPVIPDDYKTLAGGPIKMPVINEETAIQGLKLCADLSGIYPEKLDLVGIFSVGGRATSITPAAKQLEEELKGLSKEERARKVIDIMMPLQQLGSFYKQLLQDNKDPAYYGNIVTPQDTNQVLMRWKVSDNEYRVIFGDLHVETVTKEKLAGFEAALPK